jgi:glucokinase
LGNALADLLHIFNPSLVIIGGGVSQSGPLLFDPLKVALNKRVMNRHYLRDLSLVTAILGDDVGLIGALALAQELAQVRA